MIMKGATETESDLWVLSSVIWEPLCVCSGGGGVLSGLQLVMPSGALCRTLFPNLESCVWLVWSFVDQKMA